MKWVIRTSGGVCSSSAPPASGGGPPQSRISPRDATRTEGHGLCSRGPWLGAIGLCAVALSACGGQDVSSSAVPAGAEAATQLTAASDAAVLGFESPTSWSVKSGALSSSAVRTQGTAAVAITNPANDLDLVSSSVSSSAAALAGILDPGASIAVDVLVPTVLGNQQNAGSLQLYVSCPSRGLTNAYLGVVPFTGTRLGIFQTARFPVGDRLRGALAAGPCQDLSFDLRLHAPGRVSGTYAFDNLRVHSPAVMPAQPASSVDLTAKLAYAPPLSTPGSATFPVGLVQVPAALHVKTGSAGTNSALLELGFGTTVFVSCTYGGAQGGTFYTFTACTGPARPGDLVGAEFARLTILGGDPAAGTTKVVAQLALNPVGDTAGAGVIPPMPTWWGDTPDQANQIVTAYFQLVNSVPKVEERWIRAPVPDFARRHGDGTPYDTLTGPPPPNDPPFSKSGHLNPGSSTWDAYWQLDGSLAGNATSSGGTATHFDATLGAHALVWGADIDIAEAVATLDSGPASAGSLDLYLFTLKLPLGGSVDASVPLDYHLSKDETFDLPAIHIWIFSITIGMTAGVSLDATGTLSPTFMEVTVGPGGHVGAHLEGDIDIFVASGGVSATIDLIAVVAPITAQASWAISTVPTDCAAHFTYGVSGQLQWSSGGGEVDLVAKFGVCPFCDHESWPIFSWDPLASKTVELFRFTATTLDTPLAPSLCFVPLTVSIGSPTSGSTVQAGVPVQATAVAVRPGTPGNPAQNLPCSTLTWSSSPGASISGGAAGCAPFVTFPGAGDYSLTASATDSFGETGASSVLVHVSPAPAGFHASITPAPPPGSDFVLILATHDTPFVGSVTGGIPPYFYSWVVMDNTVSPPIQVAGQSGSATNATQDAYTLSASVDATSLTIQFRAEDSSPTPLVATAAVNAAYGVR